MIDRADKEARFFCVMNNRRKENLLPLINKMFIHNNGEEKEELKTIIYFFLYFKKLISVIMVLGYKKLTIHYGLTKGCSIQLKIK